MIHESYRRWLRSGKRPVLILLTCDLPDYRLRKGQAVRLTDVRTDGGASFKLVPKADLRQAPLRSGEWAWRKPEFIRVRGGGR